MNCNNIGADILTAVAARSELNNKRRLIDLQELLVKTQFTKEEIMMMYRGFKQVNRWKILQAASLIFQECPNGSVNEDTFREIYEKFFPYGGKQDYGNF